MNPQETIMQLGGQGLSGALVYTGTRKVMFHKDKNELFFKVNGRRGYNTFIVVTLDPVDTYSLEIRSWRGMQKPAVYDRQHDIYCDELQQAFERMYDHHMNEHNDNFIPV